MAKASERWKVNVSYAARAKRLSQLIRIELRIVARFGNGSDIRDLLDFMRRQYIQELVDWMRRVADGPDGRRSH